jgi:hypothetical protein
MAYFHATWDRHIASILAHGLGSITPDAQNFPVEYGVYLAKDPYVGALCLIEAYTDPAFSEAVPLEALGAIRIIVIDDSRIDQKFLDVDPNVERSGLTYLYRGTIDARNMPIVLVNDILHEPLQAHLTEKGVG